MTVNANGNRIGDSAFWKDLWRRYADAPSIALCRVPEVEYASSIRLDGRSLDHCCGDGQFAAIAWPDQKFSAGCDLNEWSIGRSRALGRHEQVDQCDAGRELPYETGSFDLVFDNSALEHIPDLDAALAEIARVTKPGGLFAFNVLNHRYFEWWPEEAHGMEAYRDWQPFFHAFPIQEWTARLAQHDLIANEVQGYFSREASRILAQLDFEFSGLALRQRPSKLVMEYRSFFGANRRKWKKLIESLPWRTAADEGAGYFIKATRR
jgi:SAM-dependent methyltransferase